MSGISGITVGTLLEINNNPGDLKILIFKESEESGKYGFFVSRGPGHKYKVLIVTIPFAGTIVEVVEEVKKILTETHSWVTKLLSDKESPITQILNPSGHVDVSKTLNPEMIDKIVYELKKHQVADTRFLPSTTR